MSTITNIVDEPQTPVLNPPMASTVMPLAIAVLIPSRGRPDKLLKSIKSLVEKADSPEKLHILIAVDDDDQATSTMVKGEIKNYLDSHKVNFYVPVYQRVGYANLHFYYNSLAKLAHTRWLMIWNDDAVMRTQGWDSKIIGYDNKFCLLKVQTHNDHPYSIFPILPRDWFILLGSFGDHQMVDSTVSQIAYLLDIMVKVDIKVDHERPDLTGETPDQTHTERQLFEGNPNDTRDISHSSRVLWRFNAADRIAWYLKSKGYDLSWWERIVAGKQDPWEKLKKNDPNKFTQQ